MRQISQNYISISSILIDEKTSNINAAKYKNISQEFKENLASDQNHSPDCKEKPLPRSSKRKVSLMKMKSETAS